MGIIKSITECYNRKHPITVYSNNSMNNVLAELSNLENLKEYKSLESLTRGLDLDLRTLGETIRYALTRFIDHYYSGIDAHGKAVIRHPECVHSSPEKREIKAEKDFKSVIHNLWGMEENSEKLGNSIDLFLRLALKELDCAILESGHSFTNPNLRKMLEEALTYQGRRYEWNKNTGIFKDKERPDTKVVVSQLISSRYVPKKVKSFSWRRIYNPDKGISITRENLEIAIKDFIKEYQQWLDVINLVKVSLDTESLTYSTKHKDVSEFRINQLGLGVQYITEKERELATIYRKIFSVISPHTKPKVINTPKEIGWFTRKIQHWAYAHIREKSYHSKFSKIEQILSGIILTGASYLVLTKNLGIRFDDPILDTFSNFLISAGMVVGPYLILTAPLSDVPELLRRYRDVDLTVHKKDLQSLVRK